MNPISPFASAWIAFEAIRVDESASDRRRGELRQAFAAGALAVEAIFLELSESCLTPAEGAAFLTRLRAEIEASDAVARELARR